MGLTINQKRENTKNKKRKYYNFSLIPKPILRNEELGVCNNEFYIRCDENYSIFPEATDLLLNKVKG